MDTNALVTGLLRDLSAVQSERQSSLGYERAASAVFNLDRPLETFVQADGTLRKIPNIGPKSERVALEVLRTGGSPFVEDAIRGSARTAEVEKGRALRTNYMSRARVNEVLEAPAPGAIATSDYRGDLQMHSTYSDGRQSLEDIIEAALARGYPFCGVTDHSYGLRIAGGVSMAELAEQHREIDELNERYRGRFRLLKGIEANIGADGSIDMSPEELARLDFVVAAPHSGLRSPVDQTARMVAAVRARGVHVLGHPRGRHFFKTRFYLLCMPTPLSELITLREIAPLVGSYFTAYSMAATGDFGEPAAIVGRTRLYARATTEEAVRHYLATRARRAGKVR